MNDDRKILANLVRHHLTSLDDPLTPLVDSYYIKRKKHPERRLKTLTIEVDEAIRPRGRLSPSSIGGCQRQAAFRFLGLDGILRVNPDVEAIFENGHWVHRKWQTIFADMEAVLGRKRFRCDSIEEPIRMPKLYIAGRLDARLRFLNGKGNWFTVIIDIKSINKNGYDQITRSGNPHPIHVDQLTTYGKGKGAKYGILLYENKDNNQYQVFVIEFDDGVWHKVKRWSEETLEFMEERKLPPMHHDCDRGSFLYEKCPYRNVCFGRESKVKIRRKMYESFTGLDPLWIAGLAEEEPDG